MLIIIIIYVVADIRACSYCTEGYVTIGSKERER